MNFDKESKSRKNIFFFFLKFFSVGGGGGGGGSRWLEGGGLWTQQLWELSFLYATHRQDLFYITIKYHDNIPKSFKVIMGKWNCIWNNQGEITRKVWKWELPFLYTTHCQYLFYISVKYHVIYQRVFKLWTAMKLHLKQIRGNNSTSMKVRVAILVCDTSSRPVLYNCKVSW